MISSGIAWCSIVIYFPELLDTTEVILSDWGDTKKPFLGNHLILSEESIGHKWNLGHYQWWFNPWRFLNICEERKCIWEEYLCSWQSWKSRRWSNFISASGRISIYGRTFSTLAEEYFNPFLSEIIFAHISLSSQNTSTINKNCKNWDKEVTCLHRTDRMSQRPHQRCF